MTVFKKPYIVLDIDGKTEIAVNGIEISHSVTFIDSDLFILYKTKEGLHILCAKENNNRNSGS